MKDLPLAAGTVQPVLLPKTHSDPNNPNSAIVDRVRAMSLQDLTLIATPVLVTLRGASTAAHVGHRVGEVAAASGRLAAAGMDKAGDAMQAVARVGDATSSAGNRLAIEGMRRTVAGFGEGVADSREAVGEVSAGIDKVQGAAQQTAGKLGAGLLRTAANFLPFEKTQAWLGEQADKLEGAGARAHRANQAEAAQARAEAKTDAAAIRAQADIVTLETVRVTVTMAEAQSHAWKEGGARANRATDAVAKTYAEVTGQIPLAYAGVAAVGTAASMVAVQGYPFLQNAADVLANAVPAGDEAFQRHLMTETVVPSLDARIQQLEDAAKKQLPGVNAPSQPIQPEKPTDPRDAAHPSHALHQNVQQLVSGVYAKAGLPLPEQHLQQFSACMLLKCQEQRMPQVGAMTFLGAADGGKLISHEISSHHFPPHNAVVNIHAALQTLPQDSYRQLNQVLQQQELLAQQERDLQTKREQERMHNPGFDPQRPGQTPGMLIG